MPLSNKLINQFVKATNKTEKQSTEKFVYGNVVVSGDKYYVRIDGSSIDTPVSRFTSTVNDKERVIVMIKNHEAVVTGNVETPSASTTYVDDAVKNIVVDVVDTNEITDLWNEYFE